MKLKNKSIIALFLSAITCFCLGLAFAFGGATGVKAEGENLYLTGARISLNENIVAKFPIANVPEGYTSATINYTFGTKTYEDTLAVEGGAVEFAFDKITPQTMNREVVATLTLTGEGVDTITETMSGFSVVNYAKKVFASNPEDLGCQTQEQYDALRTMVADLVNYGAKAQEYRGFNTANLATDALGVAQKNDVSKFVAPTETDTSITGTESDKVAFRSATLSFGDTVDLAFKVYADDAKLGNQALTLKVKKEDGEWEDTVQVEKVLHEDSDSVYVYTFEYQGLSVIEFNDVLTVQAYLNGTAEGKTLTYSVKSYVYSKVNDPESDPAMVELAKAIYNYGNTAKKYMEVAQKEVVVENPYVSTGIRENDVLAYSQTTNNAKYTVSKVFGWEVFASGAEYSNNMTSDGNYLYVLATTTTNTVAVHTDGFGQARYSRNSRVVKVDPTTGTVLGYTAVFAAQGGSTNGGGTEANTVILHKDGFIYVIDGQNAWKKVACDALNTANVALGDLGTEEVGFFTKSTPTSVTVEETTTIDAELRLDTANGIAYSAGRKQFAVKVGTNVNVYGEDGVLANTFAIASTQSNGSANKIAATDDFIMINYKADTMLNPAVKVYAWDGALISTIVAPATGLKELFGTTSGNNQGFSACGDALYFAGLRWAGGNQSIILKVSPAQEEIRQNASEVLLGPDNVVTSERVIRGWDHTKNWSYNMAAHGKYIYKLKGVLSNGAGNLYIARFIDAKIEGVSNMWIATSAAYPVTQATSGGEDTPVFCYNGYVYVVQKGGVLSKIRYAFAEGDAPVACEDLTFYNAEGVALEWAKIGSVYYDESEDKFAVFYQGTVFVCKPDGKCITSFVPGNITGLRTFAGGTATGSIKRLAGANGYIYVQCFGTGTATLAFHVYDFEGNYYDVVKVDTRIHNNVSNDAKMEGFCEINGRLYYQILAWGGTYANKECTCVIEYAPSTVKPAFSLGEYAETMAENKTEWNATVVSTVSSAGGKVGGYGHGFASDGKYFYYSRVNADNKKLVVYKTGVYNDKVYGTVVVSDKVYDNVYTYNGRIAVVNGYVYVSEGNALYKINCTTFDKSEQVNDFSAFNFSGITTFGYSAEKDAYVYVKNAQATLVKADGTVLASGIAAGGTIAGCYADADYAYVLYESTGGVAAHIMDWEGNVVYSGVFFTGLSTSTGNNVQGMAMVDGVVYFFGISWQAPSGGFTYKVELKY